MSEDATRQFLAHLWRGGAYVYWWTSTPQKRSYWFGVDEWRPWPHTPGANVYFGVHPCTQIPPKNAEGQPKKPPGVRGQIPYIAAINGLFGEFDAKDFTGGKQAAWEHIQGVQPPPSVTIDSGGGYHCYWLLDEPFLLTTEAARARADRAQRGWVDYVGSDKEAKDLARVLRVPGTTNYKPRYGPDFPTITMVYADLGRLYTLDELEELLPVEEVALALTTTPQEGHIANGDRLGRYATSAFDDELNRLTRTAEGGRNNQLYRSARNLGEFVGAGALDEVGVSDQLLTVAMTIGLPEGEARRTILSGLVAGKKKPRQLPAPRRTYATGHANGATAPLSDQEAAALFEPPSLDDLLANLAAVTDGPDAQRWAAAHIEETAQLPEAQQLQLYTELAARKVPALFLSRQWQPAVRRRAKELARMATPTTDDDPARYRVRGHRIHKAVRTKNEAGETEIQWVPLCNFAARVVADVARDDGEEVERHIAITGELYTGEVLPEIIIPAGDFPRMAWPIEQWGARLAMEPGREVRDTLRHAIQYLSGESIESRRVYTHTGWRVIDGQRVFLTNSGAIGADGVTVELPSNLGSYALPLDDKIDPVMAMRCSLALLDPALAPATVSYPLWAAMYLAPLSELIPPAFVLWLEGESGALKSSLAAVMLNHYGPGFHEFKLPADWAGTANSLEKLCFHAKDVPLVIDDFRPQTTRFEEQRMQDAASKIIRAAGNRQGRSRLDAEAHLRRTFSPRGVVLATAERGAIGKSTNARLLTIGVSRGDINPAELTKAQALRHELGYAMAGYIRWLAGGYDVIAGRLASVAARTRLEENAKADNGAHRRLPSAMAALYNAFSVAVWYGIEIGALTSAEGRQHQEACKRALQQLTEEQAELVDSEDPAIQFMQVLATLLRARQVHLENTAGEPIEILVDGTQKSIEAGRPLGGFAGDPGVEKIGWFDESYVYLLSTAHRQCVRYFAALGQHFPSDERTLRKELGRRGFLADWDEGRQSKQQRQPGDGKRVRVTKIYLQKLLDVAGDFQEALFLPKPPATRQDGQDNQKEQGNGQ